MTSLCVCDPVHCGCGMHLGQGQGHIAWQANQTADPRPDWMWFRWTPGSRCHDYRNISKRSLDLRNSPARLYASAGTSYMVLCLSVCVRHKSVFRWNGRIDWAGFWHGSSHLSYTMLKEHSSISKTNARFYQHGIDLGLAMRSLASYSENKLRFEVDKTRLTRNRWITV